MTEPDLVLAALDGRSIFLYKHLPFLSVTAKAWVARADSALGWHATERLSLRKALSAPAVRELGWPCAQVAACHLGAREEQGPAAMLPFTLIQGPPGTGAAFHPGACYTGG